MANIKALTDERAKIVAGHQKQLDDLTKQLNDRFLDFSSRKLCCQLRRKKKISEANDKGLGDNPIRILGGEDFPQNTPITLSIDGGHFTGQFSGNLFTISSRESSELTEKANGAFNSKLLDKDVVASTIRC